MCSTHLALDSTPTLSAHEIHDVLVLSHAAGNTARKRFIDALRALHESRLFLELGFPSVAAYADAAFHLGRMQTLECLRVSRALLELPRIADAFERGDLSWSFVLELTRVAKPETESTWLEFLRGKRVSAVHAEIEDARRKGRDLPRKDGYGLPGLSVHLKLELTPEEQAVFERGIAKVQAEMAKSLDGERPGAKESLLYLLRRVLETEPGEDVAKGRHETGFSPFTVVVHKCESCSRATIDTEAGRVELAKEALERIEGEIDGPNTPALRRAVRLREGGRCANPFCNRRIGAGGHAHHVVPRSKGGRTELQNSLFVCVRCHALAHAGHLVIEGDPVRGLTWSPRAMGWKTSVESELARACEVPVVSPPIDEPRPASRPPDVVRLAAAGLVKLGWSKREADLRVEEAWRSCLARGLAGEPIEAGALVLEAIRR